MYCLLVIFNEASMKICGLTHLAYCLSNYIAVHLSSRCLIFKMFPMMREGDSVDITNLLSTNGNMKITKVE